MSETGSTDGVEVTVNADGQMGILALIRSLAGRGRVEKAVQAYWDHRKTLKARAGLMPDAGFEAAYREALEG